MTRREINRQAAQKWRDRHPTEHARKMREHRAKLAGGTGAGVGKIYFFRAGEAVKIGYTKLGLEARLAQLQPGNPEPLKVLGWIQAPRSRESEIHDLFKAQRLTGEWFRATPELLKTLSTITA